MVHWPSVRSVGGAIVLAIASIVAPLVASVVLVLALVALLAVLGIAVWQWLPEIAPAPSGAGIHAKESHGGLRS